MTSILLRKQASSFVKQRPDIRPGFTVRVHERIQEGGKERIQIFEGLVINVHKGATPADHTFTVRRIVSGVGVEKIFSLHSPKVEKIEVKKVAKVRRAKLFFLRVRRGKSARLSERFTTADEFAIAAAVKAEKSEIQNQKSEDVEKLEAQKSKENKKIEKEKEEKSKVQNTNPETSKEEKPASAFASQKSTADEKDDKKK